MKQQRIGIVSDLHMGAYDDDDSLGRLRAILAGLEALEVDRVIFAGDCVEGWAWDDAWMMDLGLRGAPLW